MTSPNIPNPVVMPLAIPPVQLWAGIGSGNALPVLVANLDPVNTIYVGYSRSMAVGAPNAVPILPNQALAFNGASSIYGTAIAGTNSCLVIPGATQYWSGSVSVTGGTVTISGGSVTISGPVTVTGSVAIAGTPAVTISGTVDVDITAQTVTLQVVGLTNTLLTDNTGHTIAAEAVVVYPSGAGNSINVQDYTAIDLTGTLIANSQATADAALCGFVEINWFDDSALTFLVNVETAFVYAGNGSSNPLEWSATIPCKGQYCTIQVGNFGLAGTMTTANVRITGSFRTPVRSYWYSTPGSGAGINVITGASVSLPQYPGSVTGEGGFPQTYIGDLDLGNIVTSTPGVGLRIYLFPLFAGKVWWQYSINTANLNQVPILVDLAYITSSNIAGGTGQPGVIWTGPNTFGGAPFQGEIVLPRSPVGLIVNPAATSQIQFSMTASDF
jgi:hypothetical protein